MPTDNYAQHNGEKKMQNSDLHFCKPLFLI